MSASLRLFRPDLCMAALQADTAEEVIRSLARSLLRAGLVRATFEQAVLEREATSPTGLPLPGPRAAIPHADPEHVLGPAVALCTLARPVRFREMGNPQQQLEVELVAMLALPDHDSAQDELVRLVQRLQDRLFVEALVHAADDAALYRLVSGEKETADG